MLLNVLKRLNTKSIDTQLCVTFDFGSVFHAELEDTKVTSIMDFLELFFSLSMGVRLFFFFAEHCFIYPFHHPVVFFHL